MVSGPTVWGVFENAPGWVGRQECRFCFSQDGRLVEAIDLRFFLLRSFSVQVQPNQSALFQQGSAGFVEMTVIERLSKVCASEAQDSRCHTGAHCRLLCTRVPGDLGNTLA